MTMGETKRARVNHALNAVRTIAASLVAISHLRALFFVDFSQSQSNSVVVQAAYFLASLGHPAVIVFFVLSGYWVGGTVVRGVKRGSFCWSDYCTARMTRLWLVLLPAILLTQLLDRLGSAIRPSSDIYKGSAAYHTVVPVEGPLAHLNWSETLGNAFFVQSLHTATLGSNSPLWSLAYEFWYYALFPAALVAISQNAVKNVRIASGAVFVAGCLITGPDVLVLFPVWLLGAALSWKQGAVQRYTESLPTHITAAAKAALSLALLAAAGISVYLSFDSRLTAAVVAVPAAGLLALLIGGQRPNKVQMAVLRPLSSAAEWSYSLYAVHMPILAILASLLVPAADQRWQLTPLTWIYGSGVFILVMAAAYVLAQVTESKTPIVRKIVSGRLNRKASLTVNQ